MMIAYVDCFSGISGDMVLGALIEAGVSPDHLRKELLRIRIRGYDLRTGKVRRSGFSCTKVDVILKPKAKSQKSELRKWNDIKQIIMSSKLDEGVKQQGLAVFKTLFQAEARVHGKRYDSIHLHELGAVDCLVDIFGTLIGLKTLGIKKVYSSPVNLGSGTVKTEHGMLPVPAPATAELLKKASVYSAGPEAELTTPTGAALISSLADSYGPMPAMQITGIGSGAGTRDFEGRPNVLRVFIGQAPLLSGTGQGMGDSITVIETNIDDMNPQVYEHVMEKLFDAGALDVYLTQVMMKKGRPGIKLTVLCVHERKAELCALLFRETSTIGIRFHEVQRAVLDRKTGTVTTKFGKINVKVSQLAKEIVRITPEYDDCKRIARKKKVPLLEVMKAASLCGRRKSRS